MFFCGDVAISGEYDNLNYQFDFGTKHQAIFLNLEGPICTYSQSQKRKQTRVVYNIDKVIGLLHLNHVTGCILANNHITDFDEHGLTINSLEKINIKHVGYGCNAREACKPLHFYEDDKKYSLLSFGWNVIGCKYANKNQPGVNAMAESNVLAQINDECKKGYNVIVAFHWNYEYELYPMPAHRELAKHAIDAGACLIIGCHSHCTQGVEYYSGVPIVYGLGNWIFDNNVYFDGRLKTKDIGLEELVVEFKDGKLICHWYDFNAIQSIPIYRVSEPASNSNRIKELTPFEGMDDQTYAIWFKKNRRIHRLTPVFVSNKHRIRNTLYFMYITCREKPTRRVREGLRWLKKRLFI